jgi:hypothetical protein
MHLQQTLVRFGFSFHSHRSDIQVDMKNVIPEFDEVDIA